ncbi:hypothetical protein [Phormidium nigroviride]|uniref:hypothetical protein n=1 Tax=Phormidium nigroviride TaxID=482564 RepID=UPI00167FAC6D|nr:hypothetical protein [Oscillatoria nigro-viridis]
MVDFAAAVKKLVDLIQKESTRQVSIVNLTPMGIAVSLPALRSQVPVIISASLVVLS